MSTPSSLHWLTVGKLFNRKAKVNIKLMRMAWTDATVQTSATADRRQTKRVQRDARPASHINFHAELRNKKEISVSYCVLRHESLLKSGSGPASKNGNKHVKWRQPPFDSFGIAREREGPYTGAVGRVGHEALQRVWRRHRSGEEERGTVRIC